MVFGNYSNNNNKENVLPEDSHVECGGNSKNRSYSMENNRNEDTDQESGTDGLSQGKSIEMDNDSKCMKTTRILILVCLLLTGVIAGGVTYYFVAKSETAYFDDEVSVYRYHLASGELVGQLLNIPFGNTLCCSCRPIFTL
jgi:hypothetical protein